MKKTSKVGCFINLAVSQQWVWGSFKSVSEKSSQLKHHDACEQFFVFFFKYLFTELEIKPCGLGSRIRDMEADLIY